MAKKWLLVIVLLIVVFGVIFGGKALLQHRAAVAAAHRHFPPTVVSTATAREQNWSPHVSAVATVEAISGTEITAQIAGNVTRVGFKSGTAVHRGALLVQVDDSTQLAQLHADAAKLQLAKTSVARARRLFAAHAASQANLQSAEAAVATAKAAIEGDRAVLAKLRITAPFAGVVGIRTVSLGQYVSPGTAIVDLQSYAPIYVDFSLPQADLRFLKPGASVTFATGAYPGQGFNGRITSVGSRVDPQTRNINLQATFANATRALRPGMFGKASLDIGEAQRGIVIPNTAIAYSTFGDTVYIVKAPPGRPATVHSVIVHVAAQRGSLTLVSGGLKAGDVVVTAGQNKLRDGAPIAVNNAIHP
ncbi:MAG TPA: efflux RND transporter periplasmic adaptor subunit [Rhodanobacteraceae bacterium]